MSIRKVLLGNIKNCLPNAIEFNIWKMLFIQTSLLINSFVLYNQINWIEVLLLNSLVKTKNISFSLVISFLFEKLLLKTYYFINILKLKTNDILCIVSTV